MKMTPSVQIKSSVTIGLECEMQDFSFLENIYLVTGLLGTLLVIIRVILQFVGGDTDGDMDVDMDEAESAEGNSHLSFKILTFQGISSFMMMFGLVGLAMSRESQLGPLVTFLGSFIAGVLTIYIMKFIFSKMSRLQSRGNMTLEQAVGNEGEVYLTISPAKPGKVRVMIGERLRVLDAVTQNKEELETGSLVKVVKIVNNTMVVERV